MSQDNSLRTNLSIFLSTALHGGVIALIALGPSYIPSSDKGSAVDVTVDAGSGNLSAELPAALPVELPVEPTEKPQPPAVKPIVKVPAKKAVKKVDFVKSEALPEKVSESKNSDVAAVDATSTVQSEDLAVNDSQNVEAAASAVHTQAPIESKDETSEESAEEKSEEESSPNAGPTAEPTQETSVAATPTESNADAGNTTEATGNATGKNDISNAGTGADAAATVEKPQSYVGLKQQPGNQPPVYTRDMRVKRLQGKGQLQYYVSKDGTVTDIKVTQSTGAKELDQAALTAFNKYKFVPGQEGYTIHDFEFSLKGPEQSERMRLRTTSR